VFHCTRRTPAPCIIRKKLFNGHLKRKGIFPKAKKVFGIFRTLKGENFSKFGNSIAETLAKRPLKIVK
jgi:hypothetical protein